MVLALLLCLGTQEGQGQCTGTYVVGSLAGLPTLSSFGNPTLAFTDVTVLGTFTIDQSSTWDLDNVILSMGSGAIIDVLPGSTLKMITCNVLPCTNTAWGQIRIGQNASLEAHFCTFDGPSQFALHLPGTATSCKIENNKFQYSTGTGVFIQGIQNPLNHSIVGNEFTDIGTAISLANASSVTIGYNRYVKSIPASVIPMTGISISGGSNIVINGGQMLDLNTGITVSATTNLNINNVIFKGERAIVANNCSQRLHIIRGSYRAIQEAIDISNHTTNEALGVNGKIFIDRTVATSEFNSAIRVFNTKGNGLIDIFKNEIIPAFHSPAFLRYGIEVNEAKNVKVKITQNRVRHTPLTFPIVFPTGIYVIKSGRQTLINDNIVSANQNGDLANGIAVVESPNCQLVGNNVDGGPNIAGRAISVENTPNNILLCCNTLTSSIRGLNMLGAHENCNILSTDFGVHQEALYYDMVMSSIAPQFHRGNDWSLAGTTWDGYFNGNPAIAPFVFYTVDPSLLPNGLSKIFVSGGNASDWFADLTGAEAACVNTPNSYCGRTPFPQEPPGGDEQISGNDAWAMGGLQDADYAVIHWNAQRDLYQKLLRYPALVNASAQAAAFFSAAQSGNLGKFVAVESGLADLHESAPQDAAAYYAAQSSLGVLYGSLETLDDQIAVADPAALPGLLAQRSSLLAQISTASATLAGYDAVIEAAVAQRLLDLQALNASIVPAADYEANEKSINAIRLVAVAQNDWDFSAAEKAAIDEVAALCPQIGGPAVYTARTLQENYRAPDWNVGDCIVFDQRSAQTETAVRKIGIYPNPTSDAVQIVFDTPVPVSCDLTLYSMAGQALAHHQIAEGASRFVLSLSDMPNGCYWIGITSTDHLPFQQKLNIIR